MTDEIKALAADLKRKLHEGKVTFTFQKKAGEMRTAVGTTKTDLIPEASRPIDKPMVEGAEPKDVGHQNYYDLEKGAWRSFQKEKLISIANT
jgi:hypothetical protein